MNPTQYSGGLSAPSLLIPALGVAPNVCNLLPYRLKFRSVLQFVDTYGKMVHAIPIGAREEYTSREEWSKAVSDYKEGWKSYIDQYLLVLSELGPFLATLMGKVMNWAGRLDLPDKNEMLLLEV